MQKLLLILIFFPFLLNGQNLPYSNAVVAKYESAVAAYESENKAYAAELFSSCLALDSGCFEAYYGLSLIQFENADYKQTLVTCNLAEKVRPFNALITGLKGKTAYYLKDFILAESLLRRSILIGDTTLDNKQYLALSLQQLEKYDEAILIYEKLIINSSNNFTYRFNRGTLHADMGMHENALIDFEEALLLTPRDVNTCIEAAKSCFKIDLIDRARGYLFLGAKNADTKQRTTLYILEGQYFTYKKDYQAALETYNIAEQRSPMNPLIFVHQAAALIDLERYKEAIEKCNAALLINPNLTEAYINRGIAFEMSRNTTNACIDWQQAFALGSLSAVDYLNSSVCNEK